MKTSQLQIQGDNIAEDWAILKPIIRDTLVQRKMTIEDFAMACEDALSIPAFVSSESIRQHFSKRNPASYATIDLYLRVLNINLK